MSKEQAEFVAEQLLNCTETIPDGSSDQEIEKATVKGKTVEFPTVYSEELNQQVPFYRIHTN